VRIRGGEVEAINVKSRADRDDVSVRARFFIKMIDRFRKMVKISFWFRGRFSLYFFLVSSCPTWILLLTLDQKAVCLCHGNIVMIQVLLIKIPSVCFSFPPLL
jgi:hypothetical protein